MIDGLIGHPTIEELMGISGHRKKRSRSGRPPKYRASWCDELPELFATGASVSEVCAILGIGRSTFYEWVEKHPKFNRAYEDGRFLSEAWWTALGRAAAVGLVDANPTWWIFNMKNRHGWGDRKVDKDEGVSPEEFARRAHDALRQMERIDLGEDPMD